MQFIKKNLKRVLKLSSEGDIMNQEIKLIASNKKAYHNYFISDLTEAGIQLEGSEVKSLRNSGISLNESFVLIKNNEIFLKNAYIKAYDASSSFKPDERRTRKLLLHRAQIDKFEKRVKEGGYTMMATKVYFKGGKAKVEVALAKGKKLFDKRQTLKDKVIQREIDRYSKVRGR